MSRSFIRDQPHRGTGCHRKLTMSLKCQPFQKSSDIIKTSGKLSTLTTQDIPRARVLLPGVGQKANSSFGMCRVWTMEAS